MFDANTAANQPMAHLQHDMEQDDPYKGLRSPIPLEEVARARGVKPIKRADDLSKWPEDDRDAWEGFDESLDELRHGNQPRRGWKEETKPDEQ